MNIKAENLSKNYKKKNSPDVEVLKNIQIEIPAGLKIALTGPSGVGKSTLIHILGLMDRPTSGKVYVDDIDCFSENDKYLCDMRKKNIGFVFQFHYLMPDFNVLENILIPVWDNKNAKFERAQDILKKVGLLNRQNYFPNELSGGEQQRAALARALINDPKIIFADEPTGNLDRTTGLEIEKLLFANAQETGSTLILVTHNEYLAAKADKIIKMTND
ncbi:MAG: ABC transporter ATP-binding protein [Endomicrobium sp.]|uniref:ABC transporter ATP-binding protein n=1 Tax=Candidatus Endomicrobiellum pyrsonymphae TaxID=1408203 RepID=UPI00358B41E7|nr:ABC transporter ATP-binding protein [Endomicrobium sp.]